MRNRSDRTDEKIDLRTLTAADPVALHQLDRLGPVQVFQFVRESIAIGRDPEQPLTQRRSFDRMAAAFALAVDNFFIG